MYIFNDSLLIAIVSFSFYCRVPLGTFLCTAAVFMICPGKIAPCDLEFCIIKCINTTITLSYYFV